MATNIQAEIKSMSKSDKKTPAGAEVTMYSCVCKGILGSVQASITLKSDDLKELESILSQKMGNQVILNIESIFRSASIPGT